MGKKGTASFWISAHTIYHAILKGQIGYFSLWYIAFVTSLHL
jgi:hypothetical protein